MKYYCIIISLFIISCSTADKSDIKTISGLKKNSILLIRMDKEIISTIENLIINRKDILPVYEHANHLNNIVLASFDTTAKDFDQNKLKSLVETCYVKYRQCLDTILNNRIDNKFRIYKNDGDYIDKLNSNSFQIYDSPKNSDEVNYYLTIERILFQHYETLRAIKHSFWSLDCGFDPLMYQNINVQDNGEFSKICFGFYFGRKKVWVPKSIKHIVSLHSDTAKILKYSIIKNELFVKTYKLHPDLYNAKIVYCFIGEDGDKSDDREMIFNFKVTDK